MAPEQARGEPADERTDVYAFGLILYELLAGGRPRYSAEGGLSGLIQRLEKGPPPLKSLQPDVPPALDHIVTKCLQAAAGRALRVGRRRARRPRSARRAGPVAHCAAAAPDVGAPRRRSLVLGVALIAATWWLPSRRGPPPPPPAACGRADPDRRLREPRRRGCVRRRARTGAQHRHGRRAVHHGLSAPRRRRRWCGI